MSDYVHGTFNVEKCIRYLRSIGVEISDQTAREWADTQAVHRLLRSMKGIQEQVWAWTCWDGHEPFYVKRRRGQRKKSAPPVPPCPECGRVRNCGSSVWYRKRDGSLHDRRPAADRWKPLPLSEPVP